jgi:formylglycine-generating enzyme
MGHSNYGKVGGRRSKSGAWQWMVIGITMGFGCAAVLVLVLLTAGVLQIDSDGETIAGQETMVVTDMPAQATVVTPEPTVDQEATVAAIVELTFAAQPTATQLVQVLLPTPTPPLPTTDPALLIQATESPTTQAVSGDGSTTEDAQETEGGIPIALQDIISPMVVVDGGTYMMGTTGQEVANAVLECSQLDNATCQAEWGQDSYPAHSVTVDTFQMDRTEVTHEQYVAFLNWLGPNSDRTGCFGQKCVETTATSEHSNITLDSVNYDVSPQVGQLPIVGVTWYGARAYCESIGRRLPTEAEWERAARGQNEYIYPWGNDRNLAFAKTSRPEDQGIGAVDVGFYLNGASQYEVLDMAGNVAEWVYDYYQPTYYSQAESSGLNPTGPASGTDRVVRGGSWDSVPFFARSVHRQNERPTETTLWLGFRCAADIPEANSN